MTHSTEDPLGEIHQSLRVISVNDFMNFGLGQIAYIRSEHNSFTTSYTIHAANGIRLTTANTMDDALSTALIHNLEPVTLH